ncbi:uncharacterized protein LOC116343824 [Contarinia nasturtii]|uniref:uncharacterized protein LOC116343824 n=1 Tax=Contarinia nasturtii TaxID=265458 RepID=UPI0012D409F1|nr:uncharacterized protein LOC116343824 [Contarinia nasturtii]
MDSDTDSPNVRRSVRKKMPNSEVIQRNLIRKESFSSRMSSASPKVKRRLVLTKKPKSALKKKRPTLKKQKKKVQLKKEPKFDPIVKIDRLNTDLLNENYRLNGDIFDSDDINIKQDPNDSMASDPLGMTDNFVVSKNAGILCAMNDNCSIFPVFFPTEVDNSGVILFNSTSKKKATLKISYPKCFVVLNGKFHIQGHGTFNVGDFIKAPAGSQLGIKYLGGSEACGRIIFFKSQS